MAGSDDFDMGGATAPPDKLEALTKLVDEAAQMEEQITQMEETAKAARAYLHKLRTGRIPDLMAELQISEITVGGRPVKVEDFVNGSLPKDAAKRKQALDHLEAIGGSDLLKTTVSLAFSKTQHNQAINVFEGLKKDGYAPTYTRDIHPQTLMAFARQKIKDGSNIEPETLGLFTGKVAKIGEKKE